MALAPTAYGRDHLALLLSRTALFSSLERMLPVAWPNAAPLNRGFRGTPVDAMVGFTTVAVRASEDTAAGYPHAANNEFHEVGLFQTPAGPAAGPAPNPDPNAAHNTWGRLASSQYVRSMLGRSATMSPGAWKTAIPDQTALGLADMRGMVLDINRSSGLNLVEVPSSTWSLGLAFAGFALGPEPTIKRFGPYFESVMRVPENERWSSLAVLIDADMRDGKDVHRAAGLYLSSWRKLESGRQVATARGKGAAFDAWYDIPEVNETTWNDYTARRASTGVKGSTEYEDPHKFGTDTRPIIIDGIPATSSGGMLPLLIITAGIAWLVWR